MESKYQYNLADIEKQIVKQRDLLPKKGSLVKERNYIEKDGKFHTYYKWDKSEVYGITEKRTIERIGASTPVTATKRLSDTVIHKGVSYLRSSEDNSASTAMVHGAESLTNRAIKYILKKGYIKHKEKPYKRLEQEVNRYVRLQTANVIFTDEERKLIDKSKNNLLSQYQKWKIKKKYERNFRKEVEEKHLQNISYRKNRFSISHIKENLLLKGNQLKQEVVLMVVLGIACLGIALVQSFSVGFNMVSGGLTAGLEKGIQEAGQSGYYLSKESDIIAVDNAYKQLESSLYERLGNIETEYPNFAGYEYNATEIGHNSYELASYLAVKSEYNIYTLEDVKDTLNEIFEKQYQVTYSTLENGVLSVTVTNTPISQLARREFTSKELALYESYMEHKGYMPHLFDDIYNSDTEINKSEQALQAIVHENAKKSEKLARLIAVAEQYLGYPYVWGGSTPESSFDCSGFVCWVLNESGLYSISRTTAQGIYNQCTPISVSEAKAGDLIFFTETYETSNAVTHIGIYCGDDIMIHSASGGVSYTKITTEYYQSHFYAYGRF